MMKKEDNYIFFIIISLLSVSLLISNAFSDYFNMLKSSSPITYLMYYSIIIFILIQSIKNITIIFIRKEIFDKEKTYEEFIKDFFFIEKDLYIKIEKNIKDYYLLKESYLVKSTFYTFVLTTFLFDFIRLYNLKETNLNLIYPVLMFLTYYIYSKFKINKFNIYFNKYIQDFSKNNNEK